MLESIWYFVLFFALGVFLPILVVWALVKLWLHFFGKDSGKGKETKADRAIEKGKEDIYASASSDEERKVMDYFLKHDEAAYPDSAFLEKVHAARNDIKSARIMKPGMEKILDYENRVIDDGPILHRRLPNTTIVSSKYRRALLFFSEETIALETVDADLITGKIQENELVIPTERVLEVSSPKWTPPIHVDGRLERGECWSIKFLLKGGTTKSVKGFPDDGREIADELNRRIKEIRER